MSHVTKGGSFRYRGGCNEPRQQGWLICFLFLFQNTKMDPRVVRPLSLLIDAFQGPTRLIQKRHDKQLDLQASQQRAEKNRDPNKTRLVRTKN